MCLVNISVATSALNEQVTLFFRHIINDIFYNNSIIRQIHLHVFLSDMITEDKLESSYLARCQFKSQAC